VVVSEGGGGVAAPGRAIRQATTAKGISPKLASGEPWFGGMTARPPF